MDRVCIGLARAGMTRVYEFTYGNQGRETVQAYTMEDALLRLIETLELVRPNGRRRQTVLIIVSLSVAAQSANSTAHGSVWSCMSNVGPRFE